MDIPDEASEIATELRWGRPLSAFHGLTAPLGCAFLMTITCGAALAISLAYLVVLYSGNPLGRIPGYLEGAWMGVAVAALLLVAGVVMLTRYPPRRVFVYNEGVVYSSGRTQHVCPWSGVKFVWQNTTAVVTAGIQTSRAGAITVEMDDGTTWSADSTTLKGAVDLIPIIQEEVTRRLLPEYIRNFQAGESIPFGEYLQVSREGVSTFAGFLRWTELKCAIQGGYFYAQRRDAWLSVWASVAVKSIPNVFILAAILKLVSGAN